MMYLCRTLETADGQQFPLVGRLLADVVMAPRLQALGYVEAWTEMPSPLGPAGTHLRGHEFHWSRLVGDAGRALRFRRGEDVGRQGFADRRLLASHLHVDLTAHPRLARRFLLAAKGRT